MPSPDILQEHAGFLRALARSLVIDEARADDVFQQTMLAALERPPRHGGNLRGWLGKVARNFAFRSRRSEKRLHGREEHAAKRETVASPEEVASRLEVQRQVAEAVHALKEPYRSTIVHRFFDDLSADEIARATDTPVATVRTRLRRALDQVRTRLDTEHGGDRRTWCLALAPLLGLADLLPHLDGKTGATAAAGAGSGALVGGGLTSGQGLIVAAGLALASAAYLLWPAAQDEELPPRAAVASPGAGAATTATGGSTPASGGARGATGAATRTKPAAFTVERVVLDEQAQPIAGAAVQRGSMPAEAATDEEGRFAVGVNSPEVFSVHKHGYIAWRGTLDPSGEATPITLRRGAALTVLVVDGSGTPVAEAAVKASVQSREGVPGMWSYVREEPFADMKTNEAGRAELDSPPGPQVLFSVVHADFAPSESELLVHGLEPIEHEIVLGKGGVIEGLVLDPQGEPLEGAHVHVERYRERTILSGPDGSYRLEGVAVGKHEVAALKAGYGAGEFGKSIGWANAVPVDVRLGRVVTGIDIMLSRPIFVTGRVLDDDDRPVAGVKVSGRTYRSPGGTMTAVTGRDGRFRVGPFRDSDRDYFQITYEGPGLILPTTRNFVNTAEGVDVGDIHATRGGTVRGRVLQADGTPLHSGRVYLQPGRAPTASSRISQSQPVRKNGTFEFKGIAATEIHLSAVGASKERSFRVPVEVPRGGVVEDIELQLLPTIEIGGRVTTPGGKPRGGVQVKVAHDDGKAAAWFVASAITNDHGAFVIRNLPKRSYRVGLAGKAVRQGNRVIGQRFAQTPEPVVVSDNREDVVLYMPETGGTIKGRVLSGVTRQPVRSFQASFIRYKWFVPDDTSTYHIESDVGSFKGEVTEPGTWAVEIRAPGHATLRTKTFQLKKGGTVDLGTIELGSGGTISGVVRDAQGRPVPYARIHILDQAFKTNDQAPFTDVDGMFEVRGISPGKYSVFAVSPRHPLGILRGVAVENDKRTAADFQLLLASPLTVTVLDPSGDPLEGVDLSYTFAAVAPLNSKLFRGYEPPGWGLHRTDSRGRILKPSLPAGAVRIILNKAGFVQLSETVTLEAGKPNEVTLTMKRR